MKRAKHSKLFSGQVLSELCYQARWRLLVPGPADLAPRPSRTSGGCKAARSTVPDMVLEPLRGTGSPSECAVHVCFSPSWARCLCRPQTPSTLGSSPQSGSSGLWPGEVSIPPSTSAHSILPMGCSGQEKLLLTVTGAEGRFQPVTQGFVQLMGPETKTPKK